MKKICSAFLSAALIASAIPALAAEKSFKFSEADVKSKENYSVNTNGKTVLNKGGYVGYENVDLTGIKSVTVTAKCNMPYGTNGETLAVVIDNPESGEDIGYVVINSDYETEFTGNLTKEVSGTHNVYLVACYGKGEHYIALENVTFNTTAVEKIQPVSDDKIIDNWADTWAATDSYGRKVADFEEAGPVKEGDHYVGMMYWNWHENSDIKPVIISEVIKNNPEAKEDYANPAWGEGQTWWAEPLLGFYSGESYWVYRRHASWLANAGVDVIFFDYTNVDLTYVRNLRVLLDAYHDARESGVNTPKVSGYSGNPQNTANVLESFWFNFLGDESYSDLWFLWEGKPLMGARSWDSIKAYVTTSQRDQKLLNTIYGSIITRSLGNRQSGPSAADPDWIWLENYPLHEWGVSRDDGRVEAMSVGCSINHSYVYGYTYTGVASDEYTKGRAYTEGFGEGDDPRSAAFFREQTSQVLDTDPAFVMVDGWNEFYATRQQNYAGFKNAFVDTYDDENSRDFEPVNGLLKDDYYNLLVDFVRKYKGVRPAPTAGAAKTIDITGSAEQWADVTPLYYNDYDAYERDEKGQGVNYTTKVVNSIENAKVSHDDANLYFLVKCRADITKETDEFLHLYINTDRNYATGWEGYDYAVNRADGAVEKYENGAWVKVSDAEYTVSGNILQLKISRDAVGLTGTLGFEFKWVDSAGEIKSGDILDLYKTGSPAPMGRFNYLYTETEQTSLPEATRSRLYGSAVFKAGSGKMNVSGGKMALYEKDTRVTSFESNGTLYVPLTVFEEVMYGESKTEYDNGDNTLHLSCFDLVDSEITDEIWMYSVLGSLEARVNGRVKTLTNPAIATANGVTYIPLTYFSDCFGFDVYSAGDGVYAVSRYGKVDSAAALEAAAYLN